MVLVDVFVPAVEQHFDFNLDEQVNIYSLLTEMSEMIIQTEQGELLGDQGQLLLCDIDKQMIMQGDRTLASYNILNGARLIMV